MKIYKNLFSKIISLENLFNAWDEFKDGKRKRKDVLAFEINLEKNIFSLHHKLKNKTYKHAPYSSFNIQDPKQRRISKAVVADRVLHQSVFSIVNPLFEATFISHSFSCRVNKGSHKGVESLRSMLRKESQNNTGDCFILKCDIRKFFDSVNHDILINILSKRIKDPDVIWLLKEIISGYSVGDLSQKTGIPIGNLTSQMFANIYMNELDYFVKHGLKVKNYARYTDDFVIVSKSRRYLEGVIKEVDVFLKKELALSLHPNKVFIRKYFQGIDFLGYVIFPDYILLRNKTKKRILKKTRKLFYDYAASKVEKKHVDTVLSSYLGVLSHANTGKLAQKLKNEYLLWVN